MTQLAGAVASRTMRSLLPARLALLANVGLLLGVAVAPSRSEAQAMRAFPIEEFSGVAFYPAPGEGNYLGVDGTVLPYRETPPVGAFIDFALNPVEVFSECDEADVVCNREAETQEDGRVALASSMFTIALHGAYVVGDRFQIGLVVPLVFASNDSLQYLTDDGFTSGARGGSGFGIADPRLHLKLRILGSRDAGYGLAAVAWGTAPLGQATAEGRFIGDELPTGGGHLLFEVFPRPFRFTVGLGGSVRKLAVVGLTEVGPMMDYMAAGEWQPLDQLGIIAELTGRSAFSSTRIDQLETRAAARLRFGPLSITAGGGVGLVLGPGIPDFRILAGVGYAGVPEADGDQDRVPDAIDQCPTEPEDLDSYEDEDGCPEPDNDRDTFLDAADQCPNEPEDRDGFQDDDGCPDEDDDGDGVRDGFDSCPRTPEDLDGDRDEDGCPDADTDRDGIEDRLDRCPEEPEDTDGFDDMDGCPETDADEDGILDEQDLCPDVPEDVDRFEDGDGCPEEGGSIRAGGEPPG